MIDIGCRTRLVSMLGAVALTTAACTSPPVRTTVSTSTVTTTVTATATATATVSTTATVTAQQSVPADFAAFRGPWQGHTRELSISSAGVVFESVSDGCCSLRYDLTLQLSNPSGTSENGHAAAQVLAVQVFPGQPPGAPAPPKVGDQAEVTVLNGRFVDPWFHVTFCNVTTDAAGTCGA